MTLNLGIKFRQSQLYTFEMLIRDLIDAFESTDKWMAEKEAEVAELKAKVAALEAKVK